MSTPVKLKVCGMRDADNIRDVLTAGPHYMGFIFYEKSPRFVGDELNIPGEVPPANRVGVFVNAPVSYIRDRVAQHQLGSVQLHGDETPEICEQIRQAGVRVIKAFRVDSAHDLHYAKAYDQSVDFFLFDAAGAHYGGNARAFDWSVLDHYDQSIPFFLAGGVGVGNIRMLLEQNRWNLYAVDVNSAVETAPAYKDQKAVSAIRQILDEYNTHLIQDT
jgi:phosphoribosylanthranilate isomerase